MISLDDFNDQRARHRKYCPSPRVIVIGGGGTYRCAILRRCYPDAAIYCFEPASARLKELGRTADALSVNMVPMALGGCNSFQTLHIAVHDECNSLFGNMPGPFELLQDEVGIETVPVIRLDDWCKRAKVDPAHVDFVYFDIQGSELAALKGCPKILKTAQCVALEVAFKPQYAGAPLVDEIDTHMRAAGFRCDILVSAAIAPDVYGDAWYVKRGNGND